MKLLWAKAGKLLPLDSGGKLRTYNILRHLAAAHELTYLSWYGGDRDNAYEKELQEHFPRAVTIYTAVREETSRQRYFDYLKRFPSSAPYAVTKFTAPEVQKLLQQWMGDRRFDAAVCDFLSATLNFPERSQTPVVLFQHNVETILWQRKAEFEPRWLDRMISRIEYAKMRRYEPRQVQRFHHVIAVSEQDRTAMAAMADGARITVVPTGVDLSKYQYDPSVRPAAPLVVFTGSMDWEPNIDGVEFFCREVWPKVLSQLP